ncbi:MAG: 5-(carboxyamino)imidazole ribonucleotide synthase [Deltaproteobacteria bacterium]
MKFESKTLGILGGGQLGRMSALAAAKLGVRVHIYCPEEDSPAGQVAAKTFIGAYDNKSMLRAFAESVDVVSYEFENIPIETVRYIQKFKPVHPDGELLEIAQNRITEKKFLNDIGIPTTRWAPVRSAGEIDRAVREMGLGKAILKTTRLGYDGKGQLVHSAGDDSKTSWKRLRSKELILEEAVDFVSEISVIVARDKRGRTALYGPVMNEHKNHILSQSTVPASISGRMEARAKEEALLLAAEVDLLGVLALEMFVTKDGRILANEIAPRTHNSGHWTIDACAVSQFEQHVRTVCGLPVGSPERHSDAVMVNLLGSDVRKMTKWYGMKDSCVHLYGKSEVRAGRKMGHVTILKPLSAAREENPRPSVKSGAKA